MDDRENIAQGSIFGDCRDIFSEDAIHFRSIGFQRFRGVLGSDVPFQSAVIVHHQDRRNPFLAQ